MAEFPALPLWTDAYIGDTAHLTNEEHGVYLRLLMFAWRSQGCSLPDDDKRLALMVGVTPKKWATLRPIIATFWTITNGTWTQKRLTGERKKVEGRSESGRTGAEARWNGKPLKDNNPLNATASPSHMPEACEPDASISISKREEREPIGSPKKSGPEAPPVKPDPKGSRLSEAWFLPMEWGRWAVNRGLSVMETRRQADLFKNYWLSKAGRDARKIDWNRTWQNWVIKAIDDGEGRHGQRNSGSTPQGAQRPNAALENIARLAGLEGSPGDAGGGAGGSGDEDGSVWLGEGTWEPDPGPPDH